MEQPFDVKHLGEGGQKKKEKKLTNVSLVCMYVGRKSEMSVFFLFFPNRSNLSTISNGRLGKNRKMSVCIEYVFLSTFPLVQMQAY